MGIEKITSKILSEAESQKQEVLAQAKSKSDAVLQEAEKKAEEMIKQSELNGMAEKDKIITRRKSVADIDSRKVILAKKQEIIAESFDKAVDAIVCMDEDKYIDLLVTLGKNSGACSGLLIFNEKEKTQIGDKVVEALNKAVQGGSFSLADETRTLRGGYMLKCGMKFINNTIEALVDENKQSLTGEVAGMFFPS